MKKYIFLFALLSFAAAMQAQDDDVYFTPKKQPVKKNTATYYAGSDRDVDEYNRHGGFYSSVTDEDGDDIIDFEPIEGVYHDSLVTEEPLQEDSLFVGMPYDDDDFRYSRELDRWYGDDEPWGDEPCDCGFYRRYCDWLPPYYYYGGWWRYGWYSPWYYSGLWGWYDPWYYGYWGDWYGMWYYPIYWGGWYGGGWSSHGWLADGGIGLGYSNRGKAYASSESIGTGALGRSNRGNVYNSIAKRTASTLAGTQGVTSSRTTGNRQTTQSRTNTTRSYTPSVSTVRSAGVSSSMRSGGGSFRSGGFSGGASRGGRR